MSPCCNILFPFLPLALLFCLSCPAYPQNSRVVLRIEITSKRSGLGGRRDVPRKLNGAGGRELDSTDLVIHREGDAYYLNDKDAKRVDASLIAVLVKALTAPANPELSLDDLGVTPAWLKAKASSVAHRFVETRVVNGHPVHEAMLESSFADPATMEKVVPRLVDNRHYFCFDCRHYLQSVVVHVTFDNLTSLEARSSSQFPYMLPWRLTGNPAPVPAFNADISRAIAALMPENSTNRSRLSGENLAMGLGSSVLMDVEHQAQLLEVESKTSGTLAALRSRYTVEQASIGDYGDPVLRRADGARRVSPFLAAATARTPTCLSGRRRAAVRERKRCRRRRVPARRRHRSRSWSFLSAGSSGTNRKIREYSCGWRSSTMLLSATMPCKSLPRTCMRLGETNYCPR